MTRGSDAVGPLDEATSALTGTVSTIDSSRRTNPQFRAGHLNMKGSSPWSIGGSRAIRMTVPGLAAAASTSGGVELPTGTLRLRQEMAGHDAGGTP